MIKVNLIPTSVQIEQRSRIRMKRWILICLLSLTMVTLLCCYDWINQAKINTLMMENQRTLITLRTARQTLQSLTKTLTESDLKMKRAKVLRSKRSWSGMMSMIATALPTRSWLILIATDPPIPAGTAKRAVIVSSTDSANDETITIEVPRKLKLIGYAVDASEPMIFVSNLKAYGIFTSVKLVRSYLEPVEEDKYFRFELICEW